MEPLNEETKEAILRYYDSVQSRMSKILKGQMINNEIVSPDFLTPTIGGALPLAHPKGEFAYYFRIRTGLEYALLSGKIPAKYIMRNSPDEITKLGDEEYQELRKILLDW